MLHPVTPPVLRERTNTAPGIQSPATLPPAAPFVPGVAGPLPSLAGEPHCPLLHAAKAQSRLSGGSPCVRSNYVRLWRELQIPGGICLWSLAVVVEPHTLRMRLGIKPEPKL